MLLLDRTQLGVDVEQGEQLFGLRCIRSVSCHPRIAEKIDLKLCRNEYLNMRGMKLFVG